MVVLSPGEEGTGAEWEKQGEPAWGGVRGRREGETPEKLQDGGNT